MTHLYRVIAPASRVESRNPLAGTRRSMGNCPAACTLDRSAPQPSRAKLPILGSNGTLDREIKPEMPQHALEIRKIVTRPL
jgi:hypothetical protein